VGSVDGAALPEDQALLTFRQLATPPAYVPDQFAQTSPRWTGAALTPEVTADLTTPPTRNGWRNGMARGVFVGGQRVPSRTDGRSPAMLEWTTLPVQQ